MLNIAPVKLIGLTTLSFGILACGQPNSPTSANPKASDVQVASLSQNPSTPVQSKETKATVAETQTASAPAQKSLNMKTIRAEFDRLTQAPCQRQEKIVGHTRYVLCKANDRIVSASSSLANEGDGAGYWLNEQGDIYAIRYFHDDTVVILMPDDKKTMVEMVGDREPKAITDEARWNQLELSARDAIVEIAEQFDQPSDRETVEQVTLKYLAHQAPGAKVKPTIEKIAIVDNTALLSWLQGEAGGMTLLKKDRNDWHVVESGGGAMSLMSLSEAGLSRQTAEALLNQINPN